MQTRPMMRAGSAIKLFKIIESSKKIAANLCISVYHLFLCGIQIILPVAQQRQPNIGRLPCVIELSFPLGVQNPKVLPKIITCVFFVIY